MPIDVSIIIVNYNKFNLLDDCLSSIVKHTKNISYEVFVIDNNSAEEGFEDIKHKYSDFIFIQNKENLGFAKANNQALGYAKGKYILFLNNDTVFIDNSLKKVFDFAETKSEDVIIGCKLLNNDLTHQQSLSTFYTLSNSFGENFFLYKIFPSNKAFNRFYIHHSNLNDVTEVDIVKGAFMFCSSKLINDLDGFDENFFFYNEEDDLCLRFKKSGGIIYYYPFTSIIHIEGAATKDIPWQKFKYQSESKLKFYIKNYKGLTKFFLFLFHFIGLALRVVLYLLIGIFFMKKQYLLKSYFYFKQLFIFPSYGKN